MGCAQQPCVVPCTTVTSGFRLHSVSYKLFCAIGEACGIKLLSQLQHSESIDRGVIPLSGDKEDFRPNISEGPFLNFPLVRNEI